MQNGNCKKYKSHGPEVDPIRDTLMFLYIGGLCVCAIFYTYSSHLLYFVTNMNANMLL